MDGLTHPAGDGLLPDLEPPPSRYARLAVVVSLSTAAAVLLTVLGFGVSVGQKKEQLDALAAKVLALDVSKADKELINSKLDNLQRSLDEVKDELKRRRLP